MVQPSGRPDSGTGGPLGERGAGAGPLRARADFGRRGRCHHGLCKQLLSATIHRIGSGIGTGQSGASGKVGASGKPILDSYPAAPKDEISSSCSVETKIRTRTTPKAMTRIPATQVATFAAKAPKPPSIATRFFSDIFVRTELH